jgi:hypothetical protein
MYFNIQYNIELHIHIACKYRDILHDYFPLKLIGKYLLLYNKPNYSHYSLASLPLERHFVDCDKDPSFSKMQTLQSDFFLNLCLKNQ